MDLEEFGHRLTGLQGAGLLQIPGLENETLTPHLVTTELVSPFSFLSFVSCLFNSMTGGSYIAECMIK